MTSTAQIEDGNSEVSLMITDDSLGNHTPEESERVTNTSLMAVATAAVAMDHIPRRRDLSARRTNPIPTISKPRSHQGSVPPRQKTPWLG